MTAVIVDYTLKMCV